MADTEISIGLQDLWELLTDEQRRIIKESAEVLTFRKGESLYKVGEDSRHLVCMLRGRVKLEKLGKGGRLQIIRMFRPGDNFGYRSYFAHQQHVTEAVAMETTQAAMVPMSLIETLCQCNSLLSMYFIRNLAQDLGASDLRTVNLTQKHIRGRLADSIIFLAEKYGFEPDGCTVNVALSRDDLAALSNMTTSNAIRTLATFVSEEIVEVSGRRIKVLNADKLRRINDNG